MSASASSTGAPQGRLPTLEERTVQLAYWRYSPNNSQQADVVDVKKSGSTGDNFVVFLEVWKACKALFRHLKSLPIETLIFPVWDRVMKHRIQSHPLFQVDFDDIEEIAYRLETYVWVPKPSKPILAYLLAKETQER
ncbi:hypothetical protein VTN77DRAFT_9678 [Rasamsonia byssochlamydoides]|uniref:uncharacterized protein n=1 Tax=Rasamsonia byssochlamydoides TaxID=89139 RepID=UPI0037435B64